MVSSFQNKLCNLVNDVFPEKVIRIKSNDLPYFNEELRKLKRQRLRVYNKEGKSAKYLELLDLFKQKLGIQLEKYKDKLLTEVQEGKRGSVYPALRKLGLRPGTDNNKWFQLPSHIKDGLNPVQSAELIADHFSSISQEFKPFTIEELPPSIVSYMSDMNSLPPKLTTSEVASRILKAKKPNIKVPGDLEPRLVKAFPKLLACPLTEIFNVIIRTSTYPNSWKVEHQIPIPKVDNPETQDNLRNIAKTPFFSKVLESFVAEWLLSYIKPYLDPNQCGMKGLSTTHYLIRFLHFIHSSLDKKKPHAVLAAYVDLS